MATIRVEGVAPWDGDYPFDIGYFTNRELHLIKQVADVRAGELEDEFRRGNNDLIVAVALIAARRNGKDIPVEDLWEATVGAITLDGDETDNGDVVPPAQVTSTVTGSNGDVSVAPVLSGSSSSGSADAPQETTLSSTGRPG